MVADTVFHMVFLVGLCYYLFCVYVASVKATAGSARSRPPRTRWISFLTTQSFSAGKSFRWFTF